MAVVEPRRTPRGGGLTGAPAWKGAGTREWLPQPGAMADDMLREAATSHPISVSLVVLSQPKPFSPLGSPPREPTPRKALESVTKRRELGV